MEISIQKLSKEYNDNKFGLKDFNLEIKTGILGLIGPNGAGKSTLMRILATISQPSEGQVSLNGMDIVKFPNTVREVLGYLPQDFGVYPNLTAIEFLEYMAAIKGFTGKWMRIRIEALLDELNLFAVRNQPIGSYSGGMKQRIGIAQVLIGNPKFLILDEPTVGLDPEERVRFRGLLTDLSGERIIILSSHIVSDIETVANDIAIVYQGRVIKHHFLDTIVNTSDIQVFEAMVTNEEFDVLRTQYLISNSTRKDNGWAVRFILNSGDKIPTFSVQSVKGTLEDAYLKIIASAKNARINEN